MSNSESREDNVNSEREIKRKRRIKKLELNMKILHERIKYLDEKELSLSDLQDESDYTLCEKYKERLVLIYKIHCKLSKEDAQLGRQSEKPFVFEETPYPRINRTIAHLINKHHYFPDYCDVVELITKCNEKFKLHFSKGRILSLSESVFVRVGELLKRRRLKDYKEEFGCHLTDNTEKEEDPAMKDEGLRKRLDENRRVAHKNLNNVFSTFAQKEKGHNVEDDNHDDEDDNDDDEEDDKVKKIDFEDSSLIIIDDDSQEASSSSATDIKALSDVCPGDQKIPNDASSADKVSINVNLSAEKANKSDGMEHGKVNAESSSACKATTSRNFFVSLDSLVNELSEDDEDDDDDDEDEDEDDDGDDEVKNVGKEDDRGGDSEDSNQDSEKGDANASEKNNEDDKIVKSNKSHQQSDPSKQEYSRKRSNDEEINALINVAKIGNKMIFLEDKTLIESCFVLVPKLKIELLKSMVDSRKEVILNIKKEICQSDEREVIKNDKSDKRMHEDDEEDEDGGANKRARMTVDISGDGGGRCVEDKDTSNCAEFGNPPSVNASDSSAITRQYNKLDSSGSDTFANTCSTNTNANVSIIDVDTATTSTHPPTPKQLSIDFPTTTRVPKPSSVLTHSSALYANIDDNKNCTLHKYANNKEICHKNITNDNNNNKAMDINTTTTNTMITTTYTKTNTASIIDPTTTHTTKISSANTKTPPNTNDTTPSSSAFININSKNDNNKKNENNIDKNNDNSKNNDTIIISDVNNDNDETPSRMALNAAKTSPVAALPRIISTYSKNTTSPVCNVINIDDNSQTSFENINNIDNTSDNEITPTSSETIDIEKRVDGCENGGLGGYWKGRRVIGEIDYCEPHSKELSGCSNMLESIGNTNAPTDENNKKQSVQQATNDVAHIRPSPNLSKIKEKVVLSSRKEGEGRKESSAQKDVVLYDLEGRNGGAKSGESVKDIIVLVDDEESREARNLKPSLKLSPPHISKIMYRVEDPQVSYPLNNLHTNVPITSGARKKNHVTFDIPAVNSSSLKQSSSHAFVPSNQSESVAYKRPRPKKKRSALPGLKLTPKLRKEIQKVSELVFKQNNPIPQRRVQAQKISQQPYLHPHHQYTQDQQYSQPNNHQHQSNYSTADRNTNYISKTTHVNSPFIKKRKVAMSNRSSINMVPTNRITTTSVHEDNYNYVNANVTNTKTAINTTSFNAFDQSLNHISKVKGQKIRQLNTNKEILNNSNSLNKNTYCQDVFISENKDNTSNIGNNLINSTRHNQSSGKFSIASNTSTNVANTSSLNAFNKSNGSIKKVRRTDKSMNKAFSSTSFNITSKEVPSTITSANHTNPHNAMLLCKNQIPTKRKADGDEDIVMIYESPKCPKASAPKAVSAPADVIVIKPWLEDSCSPSWPTLIMPSSKSTQHTPQHTSQHNSQHTSKHNSQHTSQYNSQHTSQHNVQSTQMQSSSSMRHQPQQQQRFCGRDYVVNSNLTTTTTIMQVKTTKVTSKEVSYDITQQSGSSNINNNKYINNNNNNSYNNNSKHDKNNNKDVAKKNTQKVKEKNSRIINCEENSNDCIICDIETTTNASRTSNTTTNPSHASNTTIHNASKNSTNTNHNSTMLSKLIAMSEGMSSRVPCMQSWQNIMTKITTESCFKSSASQGVMVKTMENNKSVGSMVSKITNNNEITILD